MINKQDNDSVITETTKVVSIPYPEIPDLEVCHILGKGGSGTVYMGRQPFLQRDVAIKVLNVTNGAIDDDFVKRFHREAQILAGLLHPNIVSCFQAGVTKTTTDFPQSPFLAMEFIDGPSLQTWIHQQGKVNELIALSIIEKIADALHYAHKKNIIHRDIKAENILLKPVEYPGENEQEFNYIPKLADLGIARSTQSNRDNNLTIVGTMIGTPSSMAPEQFNDPDNVDFKADIYGLGCVLFHLVTGEKPYKDFNLTEMVIKKNSHEALDPLDINPRLNKKVAKLVTAMMAADKEQRPESYAELILQCRHISHALKNDDGKTKSSKAVFYLIPVIIISLGFMYFTYPKLFTHNQTPEIIADTGKRSEVQPALKETTEQPEDTSIVEAAEVTPAVENNSEEATDAIQKTTDSSTFTNLLQIHYSDKEEQFLTPGELFKLKITTQHDAHIYCYFENQNSEVMRFFPNRFMTQSLISSQQTLILPAEDEFDLNASIDGVNERIACFSSPNDIFNVLDQSVTGTDFEVLSLTSLEQVKEFFYQDKTIMVNDVFFTIYVQ